MVKENIEDGKSLAYDSYTGHYIESTKKRLHEIANDINEGVIRTYGEFASEIGIPCEPWLKNVIILDLVMEPTLHENGIPVIYLNYKTQEEA